MLDAIATYLAAQSTALSILSGTTGNLTKAFMPSTGAPDTIVSLFETPGAATEFEFSTSTAASRLFTQPSLQILTRSTSAAAAKTLADVSWSLLDGFTGVMSGTTFVQIVAVQEPFQADRDANQRYLYSCNFDVWKTT